MMHAARPRWRRPGRALSRLPYRNGTGEINAPVAVGGMEVLPAEIVTGDEDGVLAPGDDRNLALCRRYEPADPAPVPPPVRCTSITGGNAVRRRMKAQASGGTHMRRHWFIAALALIAFPTLCVAAPAGGDVIGTVAALVGTASVRPADGGGEATLSVNDALREGEVVRTAADGRLKIALRDGSTLSLGSGTELTLEHLSLSAGATEQPSLFTQVDGFVRAAVVPLHPRAGFEIATPSSVAAVRGTDWIQQYTDGAAEIFVERGSVQITGVQARASEQVVLQAGEGVTFSKIAPHTPVIRWGAAKIAAYEAATRVR